MGVKIVEIYPAENHDWDTIWENCGHSTYFHSREWAQIWSDYSKGKIKPEPKIIRFSDGARALLPLSRQSALKGLKKIWLSSPAGTFGGWVSEDTLTSAHGEALYDFINSELTNIEWRINPYCPISKKIDTKLFKDDETHALDLSIEFDTIYKSWTKGHKSATRKASKLGVTTRKARSQKDWKNYFQIYQESLKRWGDKATSSYDWDLFEIMESVKSSNIILWLSELEGKTIAGALCFYHRNHVVYWHGAALSEYFNMRPVNLLIYDIIKDSCLRKAKWFDFNPSGEHEGVKNFKKSFGAKGIKSPVLQKSDGLSKLTAAIKKKYGGISKKV